MIDILTDYSLLQSLLKPEDLAKYAKDKGWSYVGTADFNAGGLLDFYLECKSNKIKPILGLRFKITHNLESLAYSQILLYAQNLKGYHQLIKLFSRSATEGEKAGQNNLLADWIPSECSDLICVLPIGDSPNEARTDESEAIVVKLKEWFKGRLFFGLYNRNCAIDDIWLEKAKRGNIPYLFLSGVRYFKSEDREAYRVLRAISEKNTVAKIFETIWLDESLEEAEKQFTSYPHQEYLDKFLSLIDIDIPTPGLKVPKFSFPSKYASSYDYLVDLCREGYKKKREEFDTKEKQTACKNRLDIEFDVIKRCQLADYFLLVYDICEYCDREGVARGISRGSAGGSLVAFLMDISRINPLTYNLLFERFLSEDRTRPVMHEGEQYLTDAPDIDLDVSQLHRQQIIDWLKEKYGHISRICTFTKLTGKACIKDAIRSFGRSEREAHQVATNVEILFGRSDSIEETYRKSFNFKQWADNNKEIYKTILKLENIRKNLSIHASGLIITDSPVTEKSPIFYAYTTGDEFKKNECTAYSLDFAAKAGLLKVDILGLRTCSMIDETIKLIKNTGTK